MEINEAEKRDEKSEKEYQLLRKELEYGFCCPKCGARIVNYILNRWRCNMCSWHSKFFNEYYDALKWVKNLFDGNWNIEDNNWKLVPKIPSFKMLSWGMGWREYDIPDNWPDEYRVPYGTYRAMIDHSPSYSELKNE